MKKSKKQLFGFLGLVLVVAMSAIAYSIPSPEADALTSASETIVVSVYNDVPSLTITEPAEGESIITSSPNVKYTWANGVSSSFEVYYESEATPSYSWGDTFGEYGPGEHPSGDKTHAINLTRYGSYYVTGTLVSHTTNAADSVSFKHLSADVKYLGTTDNNEPIYDISYNSEATTLSFQLFDKNNNPLFDSNLSYPNTGDPRYRVISATTSEDYSDVTVVRVVIPMPTSAQNGQYKISAVGYSAMGLPLSDADTATFDFAIPDTPDVPDTGNFLNNLNIAKSDYLTTGLIIFFSAAIGGIFLISSKKDKR